VATAACGAISAAMAYLGAFGAGSSIEVGSRAFGARDLRGGNAVGSGRSLHEVASERLAGLGRTDGFTLAVFGDSGSRSPAFRHLLGQIARERPHLVVHTGDVSYKTSIDYVFYRHLALRTGLPFLVTPGDHDAEIDPGFARFTRLLAPPRHATDLGRYRLIFVNTALERIAPEDLAWLESQLASAGPRTPVVFTHIPPFDFREPGERPGHSLKEPGSAERFVRTVARGGAAAVFCGHIHGYYTRTLEGVPFVVTGGGGDSLEPGQRHHFLRVSLRDGRVTHTMVELEPRSLATRARERLAYFGWSVLLSLDDPAARVALISIAVTALLLMVLLR
jgi:hypothetical protein